MARSSSAAPSLSFKGSHSRFAGMSCGVVMDASMLKQTLAALNPAVAGLGCHVRAAHVLVSIPRDSRATDCLES